MKKTCFLMKLLVGLCLCLGVSGGLVAQPLLNVTVTGTLGNVLSGSGYITTAGTYESGITATGTKGQYCMITYLGGSGATAKVILNANFPTPGALVGPITIALADLVDHGSGYSDTSPVTSATASNGTATCSGTATLQNVLVDDPLGLHGNSFETQNSLNPVGVAYSPSTLEYQDLTLTLTDFSQAGLTLSCSDAEATVATGATDTLSFGNCMFTPKIGSATFTSTITFPGGSLPAPIPVAFTAPLTSSASNGTYTLESGSIFNGDASTLGINGTIAAVCSNCPTETLTPTGPLSFTAVSGGTPPASQPVTVNTGGTSEAYAVTTSASWITVNSGSTTGGSTGGSFNVSVNPASLSVGNYTGTVCVYTAASNSTYTPTCSAASGTPTVTVNLSVTPVVTNLVATPPSFAFSSVNSVTPPAQSLSVTTSTNSSVAFTATAASTGNWLTVNNGSVANGTTGGAAISVAVNPALAAVGVNQGTITLTSTASGIANSGLVVNVTFTVTPPSLVAGSPSINLTYSPGSTPSTTLGITSSGAALSYTATATTTSGGNWLLASGSGTTPGSVPVSIVTGVASTLATGTYTGAVVFTCSPTSSCANTNGQLSVPVTLTVTAALTAAPSPVQFNYTILGATPAATPIAVTSNGGAITYTATAASAIGWLTVSSGPFTTPTGVTASVNASALTGLAANSYSGTITLTPSGASAGAGVSPVIINATLVVSAALGASSNSLTFAYQTGGSAPTSQPLTITSNGAPASQLSFTATASTTSGGQWLTVTSPSGPTPQTLTVSTVQSVLSTLAANTYTGSITIASTTAGNSPIVIPVTLTVSTLPSLTTAPSSLSATYTIGSPTVPTFPLVTVGSNGTAFSSVTATTTTPWLQVSQNGSATPFGLTVTLVQANIPTTAGSYQGTVTITASGAANSPLSYPVTLTVSAEPALSVVPAALTFTGQVNAASPAAQTLSVSSTNGSVSYTVTHATTTGSWLSVTPSSGTTNSSLQVSVNTAGLAAGTYTGSITVTAPGATGSPAVIPVSLTVTAQAVLSAAPAALTFNYTAGAAAPAGQLVTVTASSGSGTFSVSATSTGGVNWLQVAPTSGATGTSFTASAVPGSLAPGTYTGTITISAPGFTSTTMPVTLVITQAKAVIQVTGSAIFVLTNTAAPATSTLAISASDGSAQAFTVTLGASQNNWLTVSPSSGTTPANVKLTANPAGLIPGIYVIPITVTMPALPVTTKVIDAQLTITGSNLAASPSMFTFTYQPGLPLPPAQTLSLTTISGGTVALTSVTTDVGWLNVTSAASAPATLQVSINPSLLSAGTYIGDVLVKGVGSPAYSLEIPVTLTVNVSGALTATPASLAFAYQIGGALPAAQSFTLASASGQVNFTATSPGNWLLISPSRGTTPGTVTVTANPTGLAPGTYGGAINITTLGAPSTAAVAVTLVVSGPTQLTFAPSQLFFAAPVGGTAPAPQTLTVTTNNGPIGFTAMPGSIWLGVTPTSGTVSSTTAAPLTVSVNLAGLAVGTYNGTINVTLAGSAVPQMVLVTLQVGSGGATPTIAGVINAASGAVGMVAPGMAISIFGATLGPQTGVAFAAPPDGGTVATLLAGTEVLFDGVPVPLLFTSGSQVNALAPFELSGKTSTVLQVVSNGVTSAAMTLPVVPAEPGLFTADASGTGQGAILNQAGDINSASNPAAAGSTIQLFGTGGGVTVPPSTDGALNPVTSTGALALTTTATVGGQPAVVYYAGPAPNLVSGIIQIDVTLPSGTPSGNVPVVVTVACPAAPLAVPAACVGYPAGYTLNSQTVTVAVQ